MCIAVPAQIISLSGDGRAKVTVSGNTLDINVKLVNASPGDFVLVHAGCAVEVLRPEAAAELEDLLREMEDALRDD